MSRRTPSLARRAFPAIALTAVGVGLVQGLDRPSLIGAVGTLDMNAQAAPSAGVPVATGADGSVAAAQAPASGETATANTQTANTATAQKAAPQTQSAPQTAAPQTAPAQTAPPVTAAPEPAPAAPATGGTCGEVTGVGGQQAITWGRSYGVIAVTAKFTASGDLCNASAQWQTYDSKSQRYESYAVPILNQQAEAADSANVQGVSGATAITNAYRASLQSAIDNRR